MFHPKKKEYVIPLPLSRKPISALCLFAFVGAWYQFHQLSIVVQYHPARSRRNQIDHITLQENLMEGIEGRELSSGSQLRSKGRKKSLVKYGDLVYQAGWDSSPIVVESHKLVFFTVPKAGCTVWKQLFRRMKGFEDWQEQSDDYRQLPHNPKHNGLTYLHDYPLEEANRIMTSPAYTKAIFVRDPKERFLSAFLDKALSNDGSHVQSKCCPNGDCLKDAQTFPGFFKIVMNGCDNPHWQPQIRRMEAKYWKWIDFVGHVENAAADAKRLLEKIGAWEEFGRSGWGKDGDKSIFETSQDAVNHATWAKWRMWQWYTPELETMVENFYSADYANPVLNFTLTKLY